jgi:hypothetical protein
LGLVPALEDHAKRPQGYRIPPPKPCVIKSSVTRSPFVNGAPKTRAMAPATDRPESGFAGVKSGDPHILVYEDAAELLAFVAPYIREGLAAGERCVCVLADLPAARVADALMRGSTWSGRSSAVPFC